MSRKILFCTIGQSPQVVTETVWSLARARDPWLPTEVHIVTTSKGLANVAGNLQGTASRLRGLLPDAVPVTVYVPRRGSTDAIPAFVRTSLGTADSAEVDPTVSEFALDDVRSEADALLMGNLIYRLLADFVSDPDSEVHVSLAGGRKTMSAHALVAYSMLGRPQDRASHVLVWPSEFEGNPQFWHRDQSEPVAAGRPAAAERTPRLLDPKDAEIVLVDTPAPLVRDHLPEKEMKELIALDFGTAMKRLRVAQTLQTRPAMVLDTASNSVVVAGESCVLSAPEFAIFALLAMAKHERWTGCGPNGFGEGYVGWLTRDQIAFGETPGGRPIVSVLQDLRQKAEQVTAPADVFAIDAAVPEEIRNAVSRLERVRSRRSDASATFIANQVAEQIAFAKNALETNVSKIRNAFRASFGQSACDVLLPANRSERRRGTGDDDKSTRGLPLGPAFRDLVHEDLGNGARIGTNVPANGISFR